MGAPASPQVIGRYVIYGKIAQGGMASVHLGCLQGAAGFSRTVAVKRLHSHLAEEPEFLSTMIDEARLAARIHHPNVVPTLDVVAEGGELLVVMEYVRGESLSRLLRAEGGRKRRVPLPVASAIMVGALHGLHAAHEAMSDRGTPLGIVHRDVSPQNILVGVDGVARIIDFGVAKAAGRLQTTRDGVVKGKVPYMAPEQLAALEVTRLVDVYAMGAILWETLTGNRLFKADSDAALVLMVLAGPPGPPSSTVPDLPEGLDQIVMTALARDPAVRFASAREMADALVRVVPPAMPTEVGAWVEELARDALARRATVLAGMESASGTATVLPLVSGIHVDGAERRATRGTVEDDLPTVASQPSSVSVETPRPRPAHRPRSHRVQVAGTVGGALLLAIGIAAIAWRGGAASSSRQAPGVAAPTASGSSAASQAETPGPPPSSVPLAPASAAGPSSVSSTAAPPVASRSNPTSVLSPTPRPPATNKRHPAQPAPSPSGMTRFAQPD